MPVECVASRRVASSGNAPKAPVARFSHDANHNIGAVPRATPTYVQWTSLGFSSVKRPHGWTRCNEMRRPSIFKTQGLVMHQGVG